jgi:hypothetical protein
MADLALYFFGALAGIAGLIVFAIVQQAKD